LAGGVLGLLLGAIGVPQTQWHRAWMGTTLAAQLEDTDKTRRKLEQELRDAKERLTRAEASAKQSGNTDDLEGLQTKLREAQKAEKDAKEALANVERKAEDADKQLKTLAEPANRIKDGIAVVRLVNQVDSPKPIKYQLSHLSWDGKWSSPEEHELVGTQPNRHAKKGVLQWKITFDPTQQGGSSPGQPPGTVSMLLGAHLLPAADENKLETATIDAQYAFEFHPKSKPPLKLVVVPPK
jgi:hypothetical protein